MRRFLLVALCVFLGGGAATVNAQSCPTTGTAAVNPPQTQTVVPPGEITLEWTAVPNATKYKVDIFINDLEFSSVLEATQKTITVPPNKSVNWYVTPQADSCPDGPKMSAFFSTACPDGKPTLTQPDRGSKFAEGTPITFKWLGTPAAESYKLIVTPDFGQTFQTLAEGLTTTEYTATLEEGDWGWTVAAVVGDGCPDNFAEPSNFLVGCDNEPPVLLEPANGANNVASPVTFRWRGVEGATLYKLHLAIDGGTPFVARETTATEVEITIDGTRVFWTVEAEFAGCAAGALADVQTFTTGDESDCPQNPGKPSLVSPPNNAKGLSSPVTFEWTAVENAVAYRVILGASDGQPIPLGVTEETSLTADVPAGQTYWLVQALFGEDCPATLSERFAIEITSGETCTNKQPAQLTTPANGATVSERLVTFAWNAAEDAIAYELYVATGDSDFELYGKSLDTSIERFVPVGRIRWFVRALFAACPDLDSAVFEFAVAEAETCPEGTIALTSPTEGAFVNSPVTLSWTGINGAAAYRIWVAIGDETPAIVERTNALSAEVRLPVGPAAWYVEAIFPNDCDPIVSPEGHFTVQAAANCGTNTAPALIAPVGTQDAPAQISNPVIASWNAVEGAIGYRVWVSIDGSAFQDVALTEETSITREVPEGSYEWFVQALFNGCPPVESAHAFFVVAESEARCSDDAPEIVSPIENSPQTAPVTLVWSAVPNAKGYRVFASVDDSEVILLGKTDDTELTRALPAGIVKWIVEAVFDECPSTFSDVGTFTIEQAQNCSTAAAQLVSPANNSTTTAPVEFRWNPVDGAIRYVLFAQLGDGSATPVKDTTETELTLRAPEGVLEWWIVTFFRGCDPTESEHFTVTVDRPDECDTRKPQLLQPDNGDDVPSSVFMAWSPVPGATNYRVWLANGDADFAIIGTSSTNELAVELAAGDYHWFVEAELPNCPPVESATSEFTVRPAVACGIPEQPHIEVVGQALSGATYNVRWSPLSNVDRFELQESVSLDFANAGTFTVHGQRRAFSHEVTNTTQYFYRVRGISDCSDDRGPYSNIVGVFVVVPLTNMASTEIGSTDKVTQKIFLPGSTTPLQFMATADKPWITITPAQGTLPPEGITLTVTANANVLKLGTNTATISVQYSGASKGTIGSHATTTSVPISVSLVTPVTPSGKGTPPPDALIIGAVGHATGQNNSLFESDVRVTNLSAQTMKYDINYTPSGTEGTTSGSSTTIEIPPNGTTALDDIIASVFGQGTVSSSFGMLEIRPVTTSSSATGFFSSIGGSALSTLASSRTYNFTPTGTFGQYIPATPFSKFAGIGKILSLQQVAQSAEYRANFGFLEASGNPVDITARVFDTTGNLLATIPISLRATEHTQINGLLSLNGISDLKDGRVEVEVTNGAGKITAYVAEVDNRTNDPLLVSAVEKGSVSTNRWVVPGVADYVSGFAHWVSDMQIFNAGTADVNATLTFYEQYNPSFNKTANVTIKAGEIAVLNEVVATLFQLPGKGGSVVVTTQQNVPLMVTARTYARADNGTYGQFIPAVTVAESISSADPALQVLQVEQSSRFRTNIGLNETTGNPVTVEVALIQSDTLATPFLTYELQPNEYRQLSVADFGIGESIYNARVTVKVIGGTGRVTAYGASIDRITNDPTYIPAQQ